MTEDKDRELDQDSPEESGSPPSEEDSESLVTMGGVADEGGGESEEEPAEEEPGEAAEEEPEEPAEEKRKKPRKRRRRRKREKPVPQDTRAAEALGEERTLMQQLGMPALFAGLLVLIFGIGWAIVGHALFKVGPLGCIVAGILLLAYGIVVGLTAFVRQLHGRGSVVVLGAIGLTFALLLLLVGINALSLTRHARFDLTRNRYHSLSEQSKDILAKVTEDVDIMLVVETNRMMYASYKLDEVERLMREYEYASRHIKWDVVDLFRDPERKQEIGVSFGGKAVIKCGDRREEVSLSQDNEEAITTAIYRVSKAEKDAVYYLTGHGEMTLEEFGTGELAASQVRKALDNVQMDVKELVLARTEPAKSPVTIKVEGEEGATGKEAAEDVPDEAKVLMILGPKMPLSSKETAAIQRYLDQRQGGLLVALSFEPGAPDFHEILGDYGVTVKPGMVLDRYNAANHPAIPYTENPEGHEITDNLGFVQMPMVRAFEVESPEPEPDPYGGQPPPQADATALLKTSDYGELATISKAADGNITITPDAAGGRGAMTTAVVIDTKREEPPTPPGMPEPPELEDEEPGIRIVALGSQFMLADEYQLPFRGTNTAFIAQAVSWLAGGEAISVPEKKPYTFTVNYGRPAKILICALVAYIIPLGAIAFGMVIWWIRR